MRYSHVCVAVFIPLLSCPTWAHVPLYCSEGCCEPVHGHTTSQAVYVRGTGGLEIPIDSPSRPFDTAGGERVDYEVVMRERYDPSTYSLFVGCGRCGVSAPPMAKGGYKDATVEPFTQTGYFGLFRGVDRPTYNARLLANCTTAFTVWVRDHGNRTSSSPLFWSAVVGRGESFTARELVLFPLYIQYNHGYWWSQKGWILPVVGVFVLLAAGVPMCCRKTPPSGRITRFRATMYNLAIIAFLVSMFDAAVHLSIVQDTHGGPVGDFIINLVLVMALFNGLPLAVTFLTVYFMRRPQSPLSSWKWGFLELPVGVSWLFFFGSGLWVGPAAVILAAMARLTTPCARKEDREEPGFEMLVDDS